MAHTRSGAVVLSAVGIFLLAGAQLAGGACEPARYLVGGNPGDAIAIDGVMVSVVSGCAPVQVKKMTRTRRGFRVRTRWTLCGGRRMRLKAWLSADCNAVSGMRRVAGKRQHIDAVMSRC